MEFRPYLAILSRWLSLILAFVVLGAGTSYFLARRTPPTYQATATVLISLASNPFAGLTYNDVMTTDRLMKTYAEWLTKRPVLEEVVKRLGLSETADDLMDKVSIQPIRDTQMLVVNVTDVDPERGAAIANQLPTVFIDQYQTLRSGRFALSEANLTKALTELKTEADKTQGVLDTLRSGIPAGRAAMSQTLDSPAPTVDPSELARLQTVLSQQQTAYAGLLKNYEDIRVAQSQSQDTISIIEPAVVPSAPVKPNNTMSTLLGAIVGLMVALGIVVLIEGLDETIKTLRDAQEVSGRPLLGFIERWTSRDIKDRPVASVFPSSPFAEDYRALRTNVLTRLPDQPLKSLLIASPGPGEGKTTSAANLAVVLAQAGLKVTLVDSDLRRPALHRLFGLPNEHGLTNALVEGLSLADVAQPTTMTNLLLVTSGSSVPTPAELLASDHMKNLIEAGSDEADIVVFDSPPALTVTDAAILASLVNGVVLVMATGETRREAVKRANETLDLVGANVLGVVLNKLPLRRQPGRYRYGSPTTVAATASNVIDLDGDWDHSSHPSRPL